MLGTRFWRLHRLHSEAYLGLNAVSFQEGSLGYSGVVYRSSLPATPVSTPIRETRQFSEQALRERLCRTPSPRKLRLFGHRDSLPDSGFNALQEDLNGRPSTDDNDVSSPEEDSSVKEKLPPAYDANNSPLQRKIFVGNISFLITRRRLKEFFKQFGKVVSCQIVEDHIKKKPKGYGFVTFSTKEEAERARYATPEQLELDGRVLRVLPAEERRMSRIHREAQEIMYNRQESDDMDDCSASSGGTLFTAASARDINELPEDILIKIFLYLEIKDRITAERVCKKWQALVLEAWKTIDMLHFTNMFSLYRGFALTNEILFSILKKCSPGPKKLNLSTASHCLDLHAVEIIGQLCPNLEYLDLSTVPVTNVSLQHLSHYCTNLKVVKLVQCLEIGEKGLWWLLHLCKKLETIDVTNNMKLTGQCFHVAGPKLTTAILNNCSSIAEPGFTKLSTRCRQLTHLYINDCRLLTDKVMEKICWNLNSLQVFHCCGLFPNLTTVGISTIGRLSNLMELSLAKNRAVDDYSVFSIVQGCPKLRFIDLSECGQGITDSSLQGLARCLHLKTIYLSYLDQITNAGISALARLGRLEVVRARGCPRLDDEGFVMLIHLAHDLSDLDVSGCVNVTNNTLDACRDAISYRHSSNRLKITIGGTSISYNGSNLNNPMLEVSLFNLCSGAEFSNIMRSEGYMETLHSEEEEPMEQEYQSSEGSLTNDVIAAMEDPSTYDIERDSYL